MMKKRAHPGPDGFFKLAAGQPMTIEVEIGQHYDFPEAGGEFSVRFDHYNHFSKDGVQLTSDDISLTLSR